MKTVKKLLTCVLFIAIAIGCVSCYRYATYKNTIEYSLTEIDDGVYGYYNAVTSNIPSENYSMIVLCLNGQIYTLNGDVNIHYTTEKPKLIWTDVNLVHGDTFDVYVPSGSIEMRPNLVQS